MRFGTLLATKNSVPPNLEETMRTDNLFYKLLEKQPHLALRLANLDVPPKAEYHFTAIELKQKAQRPDAVLLPNDAALPVIVLEVQYWLDALIYTRLVSETALLHLQHPEYTHFQMLLFLRSRQIDVESGVWSSLLASDAIRVVYLDEITDNLTQEPFRDSFAPDEQSALLLMHLTVTPENRSADDALVEQLATSIANSQSQAYQRLFKDLFVSLYVSKYKNLTIQEVRAMIDTREIFDDIGESLAVQQYGQEVAEKVVAQKQAEIVSRMLEANYSIEQIASIVDLPLQAIREISMAKNIKVV